MPTGIYIRTEQTKKNMSLAQRNRKFSEKHKENISKALKGKHPTEETILKLIESHKGQKAWNKGKHISEKTKRKISLAHKKEHLSNETLEKMSKATKNQHRSPETEFKKETPKEKHPRWKGGISFLPYCSKFDDKLKESIRKRDNYICQLCNKTQEEEKTKLSVHHIHYDKENCYPDLISLCRSCNAKVNINKEYYESLFMNKLNEKKLLYNQKSNT